MMIVALVLAALTVARITRLLTEDRLTISYRRWAVDKWGKDSLPAYFVHCSWCTSMWVAAPIMPVAVLWPNIWLIAALAIPAASYITGRLE